MPQSVATLKADINSQTRRNIFNQNLQHTLKQNKLLFNDLYQTRIISPDDKCPYIRLIMPVHVQGYISPQCDMCHIKKYVIHIYTWYRSYIQILLQSAKSFGRTLLHKLFCHWPSRQETPANYTMTPICPLKIKFWVFLAFY